MAGYARFLAMTVSLTVSTLFSASANPSNPNDLPLIAQRVLDHMEAGEFAQVTSGFNDQMKAALDATQLEHLQRQLESAGAVKQRGPAKLSKVSGVDVVTIRIERQSAILDAIIAIDADGKIAGLHFTPTAQPVGAGETPPADTPL